MADTTINTWTDPTVIVALGDMSATLFNEKLMQNMLYLKNRPYDQYLSDGDASWATTSTVPVAIDSNVMRVELETVSGDIEISCNLNFSHDNDTQFVYMGIQIDDDYMVGDVVAGVKNLYLYSHEVVLGGDIFSVNLTTKLFGLTAGTHSANPFVWTNGGTLTWLGATINEFTIREI